MNDRETEITEVLLKRLKELRAKLRDAKYSVSQAQNVSGVWSEERDALDSILTTLEVQVAKVDELARQRLVRLWVKQG